MKKTLLMVAFAAVCSMAQAKILRVNNTTGSGAPYTTINDALEVAETGDTIMVDGSNTNYGNVAIDKRIVLIGPGYWRTENGISAEGAVDAQLGTVTLSTTAEGTVLRGLHMTGTVKVDSSKTIINRCHLEKATTLKSTADNCILHQNFIHYGIQGESGSKYTTYTELTNNLLDVDSYSRTPFLYLDGAYIAYNTIAYDGREYVAMKNCTNCTVEKNIMPKIGNISTCSYIDNCEYGTSQKPWKGWTTDLDIKNKKIDTDVAIPMEGKGAFAGDDPYVISGIPAGPVIQDVTVPASVEQGNNLNITIKLGVQK